jgi:hypothetical protein
MRGKEMDLIVMMLAALSACWGNEFRTDSDVGLDAGVDVGLDAGVDVGLDDAAPDGGAVAVLNCAHILTCKASAPLCCLSTTTQPSCTAGSCGCSTALNCASDSNCTSGLVCCLSTVTSGTDCSNPHFVSTCEPACSSDAQRLCDPSAPSCPTGTCASDSATLGLYAMPSDVGYGVCTQP